MPRGEYIADRCIQALACALLHQGDTHATNYIPIHGVLDGDQNVTGKLMSKAALISFNACTLLHTRGRMLQKLPTLTPRQVTLSEAPSWPISIQMWKWPLVKAGFTHDGWEYYL